MLWMIPLLHTSPILKFDSVSNQTFQIQVKIEIRGTLKGVTVHAHTG